MASPAVPALDGGAAAVSALSGDALARLAQEATTPTPEPATAPVEPSQEASPEGDQVVPPSPETPESERPSSEGKPAFDVTDPAARRFIEMHGGNPSDPATWTKVLAKAMEYNNRLAELSREQETTPVPQVEVDAQQIEGYVERLVTRDAECIQLSKTALAANEKINQLRNPQAQDSIPYLERQLEIAKLRLEIPEIKNDSFLAEELKSFVRMTQLDIRDKKAEIRELQAEGRDAFEAFKVRKNDFEAGITERLRQKLGAEREQAQYNADYEQARTESPELFQTAFDKAVKRHNVDDISRTDAREWLKAQAYLHTATSDIEDWEAFVDERMPKFLDMVDRNHRAKSAQHAKAAHERAAQPGPALTPATPAVAQPTKPVTMQDLESGGLSRLRAMFRGSPTP